MTPSGGSFLRDARSLLAATWRAGRGRVLRALGLTLALGVSECAGLVLLVPLLGLAGLDTGAGGLGRIGIAVAASFRFLGLPGNLPVVLVAFVALVLAEALLERAHSLAAARLGVGVVLDLRRRLYAALSRSSWPWFSRLRASDATCALTEEAERAGSTAQALLSLASHGILALVYFGLALVAAPGLAGVAAIGGLAALLVWFRMREVRWWGAEAARMDRDVFAAVGDGIQSARTDRAHGQVDDGVARFGRAAREAARMRLSVYGHLAGSRALLATGAAAVLAVFVYLSVEVLGTPVAAMLLSLFLLNRLLHRSVAFLQQAAYAAAELPGYAAADRMLRSAAAAREDRGPAGAPLPLRDGIRLEGVSFSYGGPDRPPAVRDADLEIPAGSLTVIAGPSGSGKTTLADLVAGVLVPDGGRVLVDGVPLDADRLGSWGASVGYVAEDALLLHGTVRSNLLRARPGASVPDLWRALSLAGAEGFVRALPGGLDAEVGERGQALSGGERRRVALARALLREPSLLVLDGAADGLDAAAEARLFGTLDGLRGGTTILLVTSREERLRRADGVVRMRNGRVSRLRVRQASGAG
jgi:ATP-binding cassette subfamily C protein